MTTLLEVFSDLLHRHRLIPEIMVDEAFWESWESMKTNSRLDQTKFDATLEDETTLESALHIYDDLLKGFPSKQDEASELQLKIIAQAIYVCCRKDWFELAQKIAERQTMLPGRSGGSDISENVQEITRSLAQWEIQEVLDSKDCHHSTLESNKYSDFCKAVVQSLQFVVDSISQQELSSDETKPVDEGLVPEQNMMKSLLHMKIESWCHADLWDAFGENDHSVAYNEEVVACKVKTALERLNLLQELGKVRGITSSS